MYYYSQHNEGTVVKYYPRIDNRLEGRLSAIRKVTMSTLEFQVGGWEGMANPQSSCSTDIEIKTPDGQTDVTFWGMVFPDSIGNEIEFTETGWYVSVQLKVKRVSDGGPVEICVGRCQILKDKTLGREYYNANMRIVPP